MRALKISSIVLGVLVVLFVIADRLALVITQGEVASRARDTLGLSEEPDVSIKGFPFLTQVAGQNLNKVTLGLDEYEARVDGETVIVSDLSLELHDTELTGGYSEAIASEASGSGLITYQAMTDAYGQLLGSDSSGFGVTFEHAEGGHLLVNLQVRAMGQSLNVGSVTCEVRVEGDTLTMDIVEQDIPESIPGGEEMVHEEVEKGRTLSELPDGLSLQSVEPTAEGLALAVEGQDVDLT